MGKTKYLTEEERKERERESKRRWMEKHPNYIKEYRQKNKEKILKQMKEYRETHKDECSEYNKQWRENNKEYLKKYREAHKEEINHIKKKYAKIPMGRACYLVNAYKQLDEKYNRGECTINAKWIVDNIFSKPCHYCGKEGWKIIGCDRKDSSLPHTPDNCVPCCRECNRKKGTMPYDEYIKKLGDSPNP